MSFGSPDKTEKQLRLINWNSRCTLCHRITSAKHPERMVVCQCNGCLDYLRRKRPLALATVQLARDCQGQIKYTPNDQDLIEKIFEEKKGNVNEQ